MWPLFASAVLWCCCLEQDWHCCYCEYYKTRGLHVPPAQVAFAATWGNRVHFVIERDGNRRPRAGNTDVQGLGSQMERADGEMQGAAACLST